MPRKQDYYFMDINQMRFMNAKETGKVKVIEKQKLMLFRK